MCRFVVGCWATRMRLPVVLITVLALGSDAMPQSDDLTAMVDAALADQGDPNAVNALVAKGDQAIPELALRLAGGDRSDRLDVVGLLAAIGTPAIVPSLLPLFDDADPELRERATQAVFSVVVAHGVPATPEFADGVVASMDEHPSGAALLLAGLVPKAGKLLSAHARDTHLVKTKNAGPAVPAATAATVALSLLGDSDARSRLESSIAEADANTLEFYLDVVALFDDPALLQTLARVTLANQTAVHDNLPSGVTPPRRLADRAVEAFVERLKIRPEFELQPTKRYSDKEIDQILQKVGDAVPQ